MSTSTLDTPEAQRLADDAVDAEIVDASKRKQLLLIARHHGIDALRTAVSCVLTADQHEVLQVCGMSVEGFVAEKARLKRGG